MLRSSQNYPCGCGGGGGDDGAEDAGDSPCSSPAVLERFARRHVASTAFSSAAPEVCRAARRPNRWSSRSVRMLRRRNDAASSSVCAPLRAAQQFFLPVNPHKTGFIVRRVLHVCESPVQPETRYIATITRSPTATTTAAFRERRARLARFAGCAQIPL